MYFDHNYFHHCRFRLINDAALFAKEDGLKSVNYTNMMILKKKLYTLIHVSIEESYYMKVIVYHF